MLGIKFAPKSAVEGTVKILLNDVEVPLVSMFDGAVVTDGIKERDERLSAPPDEMAVV